MNPECARDFHQREGASLVKGYNRVKSRRGWQSPYPDALNGEEPFAAVLRNAR
jgi:hypothetical protein